MNQFQVLKSQSECLLNLFVRRIHMIEKLNDDFVLKNGGYSNYEDTTELPRHRWYYYKEGFSPNLVKAAIEGSGIRKSDLIIDPFNGSGTTTLTSALLGFNSIGVEVNPFTSFLSSVKLKDTNPERLQKETLKMISSCIKGAESDLIGYSTFSYRKGLDKWLFTRSILMAFEGGWRYLSRVNDKSLRNLLELALITAAMDNCNATRDGKCLRYRDTWREKQLGRDHFIESIIYRVNEFKEDIVSHPVLGVSRIIEGDIRKVLKGKYDLEKFKLCITSPPYLNTFDYTDIYRPELFLGKFIYDNEELYNLRLKTVRSHIQAKWNQPTNSDFGLLYEQTIQHLNENKDLLMHKDIPLMVQAYFEDMHNILNLLKEKAQNQAQIWLVVSNSAYAGLEVPVDLILGDIGTKAGWYLKEIGVLRYLKKRKTKHSKEITQLRESVIIFSKSKF
jgi:DNA modification methylase